MKKYVCEENMCTGCSACIDVCSRGAIYIQDDLDTLNAFIDESKCIGCNMCSSICPNNQEVQLNEVILWYQGWSIEKDERKRSSSGGLATVLGKEFIKQNGYVVGCIFEHGDFVFKITKEEGMLEKFRGSKYVKSNPKGIYRKIKELLNDGEKILFIGLPCQVAAVKNYVGIRLEDKLYCVDLICHGTPSKQLFELYLRQYNIDIEKINTVSFRENNNFKLKINDKPIIHTKIQDEYLSTFLSGVNYTNNCYYCKYATDRRCGDITIGDSWGSELDVEEIEKGISLILCQTKKGEELLKNTLVYMEKANREIAKKNNRQLNYPTPIPDEREFFFRKIKKGQKYNYVVARLYPVRYIKRFIKQILYMIKERK